MGTRASLAVFFCVACLLPGSCNGLQHYAALGLDAIGGAQVNLVPSNKPQDVYTGVCDVVKQKVGSLDWFCWG